jgi:hypothetical protein
VKVLRYVVGTIDLGLHFGGKRRDVIVYCWGSGLQEVYDSTCSADACRSRVNESSAVVGSSQQLHCRQQRPSIWLQQGRQGRAMDAKDVDGHGGR